MTKKEFMALYVQEFKSEPIERLSYSQLCALEKNKAYSYEIRKKARKIRIKIDDATRHMEKTS